MWIGRIFVYYKFNCGIIQIYTHKPFPQNRLRRQYGVVVTEAATAPQFMSPAIRYFSGNSRPPLTPEGVGSCGPWVTLRSPTATTSLSLGSRLPQTLSRCTFANVFHRRFHGSTPSSSVGINQAAALLLQKISRINSWDFFDRSHTVYFGCLQKKNGTAQLQCHSFYLFKPEGCVMC